jgi:hypothetical protein
MWGGESGGVRWTLRTWSRLASAPLAPYGALVAAWEDLTSTNYAGEPAHGDVAIELIPTPVVRKWVAK